MIFPNPKTPLPPYPHVHNVPSVLIAAETYAPPAPADTTDQAVNAPT